jgi:SsrA-binding protein
VGDAYCSFTGGQLTITSLHISEYTHAGFSQHPPRRMRTLLLNKSELKKIRERLKDQGVTIVPLDIHFGERGFAKIQIALVKGKKLFDKRDAIKSRDMDRQLKRGEVE